MREAYQRLSSENSIKDPRVAVAYGGGMCPEQHYGHLLDGRPFYLRLRSSWAELQVGPPGSKEEDLPLTNPLWVRDDFEAALAAGEEYPHSFWLQPRPSIQVYPIEEIGGSFRTDEDLQETFTKLLDMALDELGQQIAVEYATVDRTAHQTAVAAAFDRIMADPKQVELLRRLGENPDA
jgi:hypothetical protein